LTGANGQRVRPLLRNLPFSYLEHAFVW